MLTLAALAILAQTPDDYGSIWSKVASSVRTRYYAQGSTKAEIERLLGKYGPQAEKARSREAFQKTINAMLDEFHNSQFIFMTDDAQGFFLLDGLTMGEKGTGMPQIGAWFKKAPGGYVVQMVLEGGAAEKAGLRRGDVLTMANGRPFSPVVALGRRTDRAVSLNYTRGTAKGTVLVNVERTRPLQMFLDASRKSARVIPYGGKKYGYFHLWSQNSDEFRAALKEAIYGKLQDTDGFVLDLRGGLGGSAEGFADPFFMPDIKLESHFSDTASYTRAFGYARPLVVLVDGGMQTGKEVLSLILQRTHRATLVGETTAGQVAGTFPVQLSEWSYLDIPAIDLVVDGIRLGGKGVTPDVVVSQEVTEDGKDATLEKALSVLAAAAAPPRVAASGG